MAETGEDKRNNLLNSIFEVAEIAVEIGEVDLGCILLQVIAVAEYRREILGMLALNQAVGAITSMGCPGPRAPIIAKCDALLEQVKAEWHKDGTRKTKTGGTE